MSGAGFRASIPSSVRKTIQNIKEITGNHSDEDIYAMLKDCSMDPNETTQKLLLQDTFHEVKRRRDRRKENLNSREPVESRWRLGTQGRGLRGGRGKFSSHNASLDAGGSKNSGTGKDAGSHQVAEKVAPPLPAAQETISKEKSSGPSSTSVIANGPTSEVSGTTSGVSPPPSSAGSRDKMDPSYRDPVLVPSTDSWVPGAAGAIRRDIGSQRPPGELNSVSSAKNKLTAASEIDSSSVQGKIQVKSQGVAKNHPSEISSTVTHESSSTSRPSSSTSRPSSSTSRPSSSTSRPSSNYGPQKAGSNKEWKPKPTNTINQGSEPASASETPSLSAEITGQLQSASGSLITEEATSELQKKLVDFHLPQRQHVILPNHIHVPESEKNKFSFGSLGLTLGVNVSAPESEKSSAPLSETSQAVDDDVEEEQASSQNAAVTSEAGDYAEHPQSPTNVAENLPSHEIDGSSSAIQEQEYNESKQATALSSGGHQYSEVQTSQNYSLGFMPPILSTQAAPFDNSDSETRDISRPPSYVVHQPFDPTSYYAQFYRSGADSDGRLSPFPSAGVATKYNGNVTVLPTPNSQSPQEVGVLSTTGPTPLVTQAAGLMQSSIAVTQQPVPVFRPPTGVHISHYPPNYIPYGHYFSPFYVPPPGLHQFLGNTFPQQPPQASTVYPPPPVVAATGMKYPLPQFKPAANAANPTHLVMPSAYGAYGSSPSGYNHNSAAAAGNTTSNEDLGSSQFKESNVYMGGQQSEGSAVWVATPGRDISSLPTSSFYNLPPQVPHVTFAPTQAGHGTFAGIYHHPAQAVTAATVHPLLQQPQTMAGAVDMVGPGGNVYQQPQHAQVNWPSNY